MLAYAKETCMDVRYFSGVNLALCNPETREAMYRALVEGEYKIRQVNGSGEYVEVSQVFIP